MKKHTLKSCCGSRSHIWLLEGSPIRKSHVEAFTAAGYVVPPNFTQSGVFYATRGGVIVTGAFGTQRLSVRCSGPDCESKLAQLEVDLTAIVK